VIATTETGALDRRRDVPVGEPTVSIRLAARRSTLRWERALAATIVLCATVLSVFWALRVPVFQEPDEVAHADAAFAYFDAGRPFIVHNPTIANFVTPELRYLMKATDYRRMRYNNHAAVRDGYGTRAYFRALDANAPPPSNAMPGAGGRVPYALAFYPSTYYYVVALAMRAGWISFGHSLSAAIFAGRLLNVAMFATTLVLAYAVLSKLSFTSAQRLMLLAGVAFFPLSTWMGAYIQPDNQSALLMTATLLAGLALRRQPASLARLALYTAAASALGVTKLQYALVAIVAFGFAFRGAFDRETPPVRLRALAGTFAIPLVAAFCGRFLSPIGGLYAPPSGSGYADTGVLSKVGIASYNLLRSATGTLLGGQTFSGFWLHFGLRSGGVFPPGTTAVMTALLVALTVLTFAAWGVSQLRLVKRLRYVATRYGAGRAFAFLGTDPTLNAYVLLTGLLLSLSAFTNGDLMLQGRYWYPILLPIVLLSVRSIGGAVPHAKRRVATSLACTFWLCYSAIAAPCAAVAMNDDFYHHSDAIPTSELGEVESIEVDGRASDRQSLTVTAGSVVTVRGDALDTSLGLPATNIGFRVDGGKERRAIAGLPDRKLVLIFNDQLLANGGFRFDVPTRGLAPGSHEIEIDAFEARAPKGLPIETVRFVVIGNARS
jgi:hypothetical protein